MPERHTVTAAARVSPAELAAWQAKAAAVSLSALLRQAMARTRSPTYLTKSCAH